MGPVPHNQISGLSSDSILPDDITATTRLKPFFSL